METVFYEGTPLGLDVFEPAGSRSRGFKLAVPGGPENPPIILKQTNNHPRDRWRYPIGFHCWVLKASDLAFWCPVPAMPSLCTHLSSTCHAAYTSRRAHDVPCSALRQHSTPKHNRSAAARRCILSPAAYKADLETPAVQASEE